MRPYTTVGGNRNEEDCRWNWRGNKNYWRKKRDRKYKKKMRQRLRRQLWKEILDG